VAVTEAAPTYSDTEISGERADILAELAQARYFLRFTTRDLDDERARRRTTASALTLGGLIKHVTDVERSWAEFILIGPEAMSKDGKDFSDWTEEDFAERERSFQLQADETLIGALEEYERVGRRTDELVRSLPSLDARQPLPKAPWNTVADQSARRTFLHIIAETTQHAGHADIIRESLDGQKSMG
jgi:uncharacterized damage-inducible protein DinB